MRVRLLAVIAYVFLNNSAPCALSADDSPNLAQDKAIETAMNNSGYRRTKFVAR